MNTNINHDLKLIERNMLTITGVKKVISFDTKEFNIDSVKGIIKINGENLELLDLNNENMILKVKGLVNSIIYLDHVKKEESFISKLFK